MTKTIGVFYKKKNFAGAGEEGDSAPLPGPGLAAVTGGA